MKNLEAKVNLRLEGLNAQVQKAEKEIDKIVTALNKLKQSRDKLAIKSATVGLTKKETQEYRKLKAQIQQTNTTLTIQRSELSKLNAQRRDEIREVKKAETAQKKYEAALENTTQSQKKLSAANQQYKQTAGSASAVALEFNRIIQDAPFGIIGVGNNIQQLAAQFTTLRQRSRSSGEAVSAALTAIVSPVNLLSLGISGLTTLFTLYALGVFDARDETDALADSLEEARKQLDGITLAAFDAKKALADEVTETETLFAVLGDQNVALDVRNKAYDRLLEIYPKINSELSREQALAGDLASAYEDITEFLTARTNLQAVEEKLVDTKKEQLDIETSLKNLIEERLKVADKLDKISSESLGEIFDRSGFFDKLFGDADPTKLVATLANALNKDFGILFNQDELASLNEEILELRRQFGGNVVEISELEKKAKDAAVELLSLKDLTKKDSGGGGKFVFDQPLIEFDLEAINAAVDAQVQAFLRARQRIVEEAFPEFAPDTLEDPAIKDFGISLNPELFEEDALEYIDSVRIFKDVLTEEFGNIGEVFESFGQIAIDVFDIQNRALRRYLRTTLQSLPKIVDGIKAFAKAKKEGAQLSILWNKKEATANGIKMATDAASALGAIGAAALPVILGGVLGLINGSFQKNGLGSAGGGGGAASSNAGTSLNGSFSGTGFVFPDFEFSSVVEGTDIKLVLSRTEENNA